MANGWISLHRSIFDHWLWKDTEPFDKRSAWTDLLLLANYEDKKIAYKGEVIICKRGDVNLSISALADRWHWNRWKVKRFLELLESDGMCTVKCTTHRTTITLENYGFFQDPCTTNATTKCTTSAQPVHITNKDNKQNNTNNIKRFKKTSGFSDFDQKQEYDFDALEQLVLEKQ